MNFLNIAKESIDKRRFGVSSIVVFSFNTPSGALIIPDDVAVCAFKENIKIQSSTAQYPRLAVNNITHSEPNDSPDNSFLCYKLLTNNLKPKQSILVLYAKEISILRRVFNLALATLNDEKRTLFSIKYFLNKKVPHKVWSNSEILKLLNDSMLSVSTKVSEDNTELHRKMNKHPPVIPKKTFEAVQRMQFKNKIYKGD